MFARIEFRRPKDSEEFTLKVLARERESEGEGKVL